jgi:hypothetical protein
MVEYLSQNFDWTNDEIHLILNSVMIFDNLSVFKLLWPQSSRDIDAYVHRAARIGYYTLVDFLSQQNPMEVRRECIKESLLQAWALGKASSSYSTYLKTVIRHGFYDILFDHVALILFICLTPVGAVAALIFSVQSIETSNC